jgi:hypothetical protein
MPDKRLHRGPHPEDANAFAAKMLPQLSNAVNHLSWLLSHGYAEKSASTLVGDRFALTERQRIAVRRCACSDQNLRERRSHEVRAGQLSGALILIDGYNVITTVETALSGGFVIAGRDGCFRDMASMHGSFKRVTETPSAIALIGRTLARCQVGGAVWYLDQPVSNSGRLRQLLLEIASAEKWDWRVELAHNPDAVLAATSENIATADSIVLNHCARWMNLAREVVREHVPEACVISLPAPESA